MKKRLKLSIFLNVRYKIINLVVIMQLDEKN